MNRRRKSFRKLDLAMAQLRRVVESEGSELVRDGRVRLALRELEKSRKGGQVDLDRIVKAVTLISEAASDRFLNGDERRK
jgi:hypothetical protein